MMLCSSSSRWGNHWSVCSCMQHVQHQHAVKASIPSFQPFPTHALNTTKHRILTPTDARDRAATHHHHQVSLLHTPHTHSAHSLSVPPIALSSRWSSAACHDCYSQLLVTRHDAQQLPPEACCCRLLHHHHSHCWSALLSLHAWMGLGQSPVLAALPGLWHSQVRLLQLGCGVHGLHRSPASHSQQRTSMCSYTQQGHVCVCASGIIAFTAL